MCNGWVRDWQQAWCGRETIHDSSDCLKTTNWLYNLCYNISLTLNHGKIPTPHHLLTARQRWIVKNQLGSQLGFTIFFLRCNQISHNLNCFETIPSFITTVWECHFPPYFYAPSKRRIITLKWTYKMYWYRSFWDQNLNQQLLISASTWLCTYYHVPANSVWCWSLSATISTHVRQSMKKTLLMLVTSPLAYPVIWESLVINFV